MLNPNNSIDLEVIITNAVRGKCEYCAHSLTLYSDNYNETQCTFNYIESCNCIYNNHQDWQFNPSLISSYIGRIFIMDNELVCYIKTLLQANTETALAELNRAIDCNLGIDKAKEATTEYVKREKLENDFNEYIEYIEHNKPIITKMSIARTRGGGEKMRKDNGRE